MSTQLSQTDVVLRLQKAMREMVTPGMKTMIDLEINKIKRMTTEEFNVYLEEQTKGHTKPNNVRTSHR